MAATKTKPKATKAPVVTHKSAQPTTDAKGKVVAPPGGHTPGKTFVGKSKKHDGRKWVYETSATGKVTALRPHSSNTVDKQPAKKTAPATGVGVPPAEKPYGEFTDQINKTADDAFRGEEATARTGQSVAEQHKKDLESVYDRFRAQLLGQDDAMRSQQRVALAQNADSQRQALTGLGQAVGQGAQAQASTDQRTGTRYADEVAGIGAAGTAGAAAVAQPAQTAQVAQANTDQSFMAQLGAIMDTERGRASGTAAQGVQKAIDARTTVGSDKAAGKTKLYQQLRGEQAEAVQNETENELAARALLSKDKDSLRDYRVAKKQIDANIGIANANNATAVDIATGRNNTNKAIATGNNDTARRVAETAALARINGARTAAQATLKAAGIRADSAHAVALIAKNAKLNAAHITAGTGKTPVTVTTADGKTYTMSAADRKKWNDRRRASIDAATNLQRALRSEKDEGKAIARTVKATHLPANVVGAMLGAANGKPATPDQRRALASYFPTGLIPPGFIDGKVVR